MLPGCFFCGLVALSCSPCMHRECLSESVSAGRDSQQYLKLIHAIKPLFPCFHRDQGFPTAHHLDTSLFKGLSSFSSCRWLSTCRNSSESMFHPFSELTNRTPSPSQPEDTLTARKHSPWTAARHKKKTRSFQCSLLDANHEPLEDCTSPGRPCHAVKCCSITASGYSRSRYDQLLITLQRKIGRRLSSWETSKQSTL